MRALFTRRPVPPPAALAAVAGERVLAFADVAGGGVVLATPRGLWWPDGESVRLIGWHFVDKAVWRDGQLIVAEAEVVDDVLLVDRPEVSVTLSEPRNLPPIVRARIEANVVRSELLPVPGGSARLVGRRTPGRDGVTWLARLEAGTSDNDEVRAHVSAGLEQLRSSWSAALEE